MNEIVYSHRPAAGVSVAAANFGSKLVVALALVNDGTSRNQLFHEERRDAFSRAKARSILNNRLKLAAEGVDIPLTVVFDTNMTARQFMTNLRPVFKPTHDESDTLFVGVDLIYGIESRYRKSANEIIETTMNMVNEVVANASSRI